MAMAKQFTLENWDRERNKDNDEYFADPQFRWDYMTHKMPRKAKDCERLVQDQVNQLVRQRGAGVTLRILSLGSGPGTDQLAVIRACRNTGLVSRVEVYGVDKFDWPRYLIDRELVALQNIEVSQLQILKGDFVQYVQRCIDADFKFDLVISFYARARGHCQFLAQTARRVLRPQGRVFVIDNNSYKLKRGLLRRGTGFRTVCTRIGGKLIFLAYGGQ